MPSEIINVEPLASDFSNGAMMVTFRPSPSPDIDHYVIICTGDTCTSVIVDNIATTAVVTAKGDISGVSHTLCVYAVNKCGVQSPMSCMTIDLKKIEGKVTF